MAGDPDLRAEVSRLNQKISSQEIGAVVQSELTGIDPANPFSNITAPGILARHEYASAARDLVPLIGREAYEALVAGRLVVPKSKYDEAVWRKEYNMSDPEWMANYRAGSKAHRDQMRKILIVLGAKVAG